MYGKVESDEVVNLANTRTKNFFHENIILCMEFSIHAYKNRHSLNVEFPYMEHDICICRSSIHPDER